MKVAVVGCAHGDLDNIYNTLKQLEGVEKVKIDLLLCCGDFQAVRNEDDLESVACPPKYRTMNTFWKYYSGEKETPYPTIFIGGNHEATKYLWELYFGGWAAPNMYFLGFSGVVNFGGLRIGGYSGIYNPRHYNTGHFERYPYNPQDLRSVYHLREYQVRKLLEVKGPLDVMMSHDWPRGITGFGDEGGLLMKKPYFREEVKQNALGSPAGMQLLRHLQPSYWFSGHLHVKFPAVVPHGTGYGNGRGNGQFTKFLALDKCLRGRPFMQVVDIEPSVSAPLELSYDEEWLAITRAFHGCFPLRRAPAEYSGESDRVQAEMQWVKQRLAEKGEKIPENFVATARAYDPNNKKRGTLAGCVEQNPQTVKFLELLDLGFPLSVQGPPLQGKQKAQVNDSAKTVQREDPNEIDLNDEPEGCDS